MGWFCGLWVVGWLDGWVALKEWKVRLIQNQTKLELERGLSLAISTKTAVKNDLNEMLTKSEQL